MSKAKQLPAKIISFPVKSANPVENSDRIIRANIIGNRVEDLGIKDGDEVIVNTFEAVGNGNLIVIDDGKDKHLGIARFIGDGKLELHYGFEDGHEKDVFKLSEIKFIGRVIYSERSWK